MCINSSVNFTIIEIFSGGGDTCNFLFWPRRHQVPLGILVPVCQDTQHHILEDSNRYILSMICADYFVSPLVLLKFYFALPQCT